MTPKLSTLITALKSLGLSKEASLIKLSWGSENEWRNAFKAILNGRTKVIAPTQTAIKQCDKNNDTKYKTYISNLPKDEQDKLLNILSDTPYIEQSNSTHSGAGMNPGDYPDEDEFNEGEEGFFEDEDWETQQADEFYEGQFAEEDEDSGPELSDLERLAYEMESGKTNIDRIEGRYAEELIMRINNAIHNIIKISYHSSMFTERLERLKKEDRNKRTDLDEEIKYYLDRVNEKRIEMTETIDRLINDVFDFPKRTLDGELGRFTNRELNVQKTLRDILRQPTLKNKKIYLDNLIPKISEELKKELLLKLTSAFYRKFIPKYNTDYDKPRKPMSKSPNKQYGEPGSLFDSKEDEDSYIERWHRMDREGRDKAAIDNNRLKVFIDALPDDSIISVLRAILGSEFKTLEMELNNIGIKLGSFIQ